MDEQVVVAEVVPGDYAVRIGDRRVRVLVPAGVGVPGVSDEELAGAVVVELVERGGDPAGVIDVSSLVQADPGILHAVAERCDPDG